MYVEVVDCVGQVLIALGWHFSPQYLKRFESLVIIALSHKHRKQLVVEDCLVIDYVKRFMSLP